MATLEFQNPSSSSSNPGGRYDIFLSFRGSDTRYKFTDHLYHALMREGFQTFRDDDEIGRGDVIKPQLQKAIMNSRTSVIVLSENYANSTACLFELQTIIELCKKSDYFVLPVFYEVEPSVLKAQSKNLVFEKKEVAAEKVQGWSAALNEVASMAGMVFRKESDGYEADFIEEIVGELKSKLVGNHLRVDDHLVSMDSRTKQVTLWLKDRSTRVGILLIRGMGGIGKMTIAKVVFNSNHGRFDAACFLQNISEVAKAHNGHGLVHLQRQLLSDILKNEERKVNDVNDGCRRMKYALRNKRVFLVLDDVDKMDQLFALAGKQDWFSEGSNIIITTRLNSLMKNSDEIYYVYWPEKLSDDESLELFSWYGFRQKCPIKSHMALSKKFVDYCDGLPLALQVLGSSCQGKSIDVWESDLHKLQAHSDNTIREKLEISYDSLQDNHDKNLFLEIACFFVGKKKKETITILESCDNFALARIHNLVDRNLLTIEDEKLQMHQLLQDMGKQIVCRESDCPKERSRIWRSEKSFDILFEKIGTNKIKGLVLDMNMLGNSNKVVFEANTFEKMYNLRLLKLSAVQLSGSYKACPKNYSGYIGLVFLQNLSPNFIKDLTGLQTLDLSGCHKLRQIRWSSTILQDLFVTECGALEEITYETGSHIKYIISPRCPNLYHIQGHFKFLPVKEVDVELINSIGFFNLDSMADAEAQIVNFPLGFYLRFPIPIQIVNEGNLFYTFFPGREVPHWFINKNGGSTI